MSLWAVFDPLYDYVGVDVMPTMITVLKIRKVTHVILEVDVHVAEAQVLHHHCVSVAAGDVQAGLAILEEDKAGQVSGYDRLTSKVHNWASWC